MTANNQNQDNGYVEPLYQRMQYGAPELKKSYMKFFSRGVLLAIAIHIVFISLYIFSLYLEKLQAERREQFSRNLELQNFQTQEQETQEEETQQQPEVEQAKVEALKDDAALAPEPVAKKEAVLETIKDVQKLEEIKTAVDSRGREDFDPSKVTDYSSIKLDAKDIEKKEQKEEKKEKTDSKTKVYQQFEVDKAPVAVNLGQVQASMRYPEIARQNGIEGKVTVKVLVGTDGSVIQIGSISGPEVFHSEVSSKVMNLQFNPAIQQGQPVKCWVTVPFNFTLTGKFKKDKEEKKEEIKEEKKEEKKTETPKE